MDRSSEPPHPLLAAQEALLSALERPDAAPERLERAYERCAAALAALERPEPALLRRAQALNALLCARAGSARDTTLSELANVRRTGRWLASRRPADPTGDTCDVSG